MECECKEKIDKAMQMAIDRHEAGGERLPLAEEGVTKNTQSEPQMNFQVAWPEGTRGSCVAILGTVVWCTVHRSIISGK